MATLDSRIQYKSFEDGTLVLQFETPDGPCTVQLESDEAKLFVANLVMVTWGIPEGDEPRAQVLEMLNRELG